jgi:hypothetical protein
MYPYAIANVHTAYIINMVGTSIDFTIDYILSILKSMILAIRYKDHSVGRGHGVVHLSVLMLNELRRKSLKYYIKKY